MVFSFQYLKNLYISIALLLLASSSFVYSHEMINGYNVLKSLVLVISVALILPYFIAVRPVTINFHPISIIIALFSFYCFLPPLLRNPLIILNTEYITNISVIILYYLMLGLFVYKSLQRYIVLLVIMSSIAMSLCGLLQWSNINPSVSDEFKITGPYLNPGPYACILSLFMVTPLSIAILAKKYNMPDVPQKSINLLQKVCYIIFAIGCITLSLTAIRTSWISTLFSIAFSIILIRHLFEGQTLKRKSLQFGIVVFAILSVAGLLALKTKKESSQGRILIWKVSLTESKNIFWGNGYSYFKHEYNTLQSNYFSKHPGANSEDAKRAGNVSYSYNEGIELLANYGIVGLIMITTIIILLIRTYARNFKSKELFFHLAFICLLNILIQSVSSYPFSMVANKTYTMIFLAMFVQLSPGISISFWETSGIRRVSTLIMLVLSMTLVGISNHILKKYQIWTKADLIFRRFNNVKLAAKLLQPEVNYEGNGELMLYYGKLLFLSQKYNESILILENAKKYISDPILFYTLGQCYSAIDKDVVSESYFNEAINICPNNAYPRYLLFLHYVAKKNNVSALKVAIEINGMQIKIQSRAVEEIKEKVKDYLNGEEVSTSDF